MPSESTPDIQDAANNLEKRLQARSYQIKEAELPEGEPMQCENCMSSNDFKFHNKGWFIEGNFYCLDHKATALEILEQIEQDVESRRKERDEIATKRLENSEPNLNNENPDIDVRRQLESEGWQRSGNEVTHLTPFNPGTGKFDPKEIKTAVAIEREYLTKYSPHGFTEIKLIRRHVYKDSLGFVEDQHSYEVYMRKST